MTSRAPKRESINPGAARAMYDALHFSQATRVGNTIWVSGQVGIDAAMKPAKGMEAQAHLTFQGLRSVLEAAGGEPGRCRRSDDVSHRSARRDAGVRGGEGRILPRSLSVMDRGRRDATGPTGAVRGSPRGRGGRL